MKAQTVEMKHYVLNTYFKDLAQKQIIPNIYVLLQMVPKEKITLDRSPH